MTYVNRFWGKYRCFVDSPIIKVIVRDGYACVLTRYKDMSHPARDRSDPLVYLQAAHIIPRSIGEFKNYHTSDSVGHLFVKSIALCLQDLHLFLHPVY